LGLSVHNYLSQQNCFPPLFTNWNVQPYSNASPNASTGPWMLSWAVALMSNLEQSAIYNAANYSYGAPDPANLNTVTYTKVSVMMCPSENLKNGPWITSFANYAANYGGPAAIAAWTGIIVPMNGSNASNSGGYGAPNYTNYGSFGTEGITDGTSNTAMFSEKLIGISSGTVTPGSIYAKRVMFSVNSQFPGFTIDSNNSAQALQFVQACKSVPGTTNNTGSTTWSGAVWSGSHSGTLRFNSYTHTNTPNGLSCSTLPQGSEDPGYINYSALTAQSNHPGGINVGFGDGSVKFIKDSINPQTWWAIGSRNQGETVSSDSY
jgi:prepilin-type processing-associated H-X9-DG protein